jgi:two-component system sensor histidine kinase TctE
LLAWLLIPLGLLTGLDIVDDYLDANRTASLMFDRLLGATARALAQDIRVVDGRVALALPPGVVEAFAWPVPDRVDYRVSDEGGRTLAGNDALPRSPGSIDGDEPQYRTAVLDGQPVRIVAFVQPGARGGDTMPLRVEVAATMRSRDALARETWGRNARQQIVILVLAALLAWIGLTRGLSPLLRLGRTVTGRSPDSLEPLDASAVQSELRPLVVALNAYIARLAQRMAAQRRFIGNASHQLRTPLTLLNTQVHYALATDDLAAKDEALRALQEGIRQSNRIANQLLTLSRAEPESGIPVGLSPVVLDDIVRLALEKVAGLAERRGIDLGLDTGDAGPAPAVVQGDEVLLLELVANLVDNAVRYTPSGGHVTVGTTRVPDGWSLTVTDSGPGIPPAERERVFERFYRVAGSDGEGSGLGLSIVQEIARACGATVSLREAAPGPGLVVDVRFPDAEPARR